MMDECEMRWIAVEYAVLFDRYWDCDCREESDKILDVMREMRSAWGDVIRDRALDLLARHGRGPRHEPVAVRTVEVMPSELWQFPRVYEGG